MPNDERGPSKDDAPSESVRIATISARFSLRAAIITTVGGLVAALIGVAAVWWEKSTPNPSSAAEPTPSSESASPETPLYSGVALTLDPPKLGYEHATLVDLDGDGPRLMDGEAADHPDYDLFYDNEFAEEPSAILRLNHENGVLFGYGPDERPTDPTVCAQAVLDSPLPNYLRQSSDPLERGAGYCLVTTDANVVWFHVLAMEHDPPNYGYTLQVTLWSGD
ncbi:hypothetical protein [Stackebrandtia soli]|uniref:hypothetical protein n=1 Tax=Stackebrandtia soli TaxID=1892856 RepID=UPI0039EC3652